MEPKKILLFYLTIFSLMGCNLFNRGYFDVNNQYYPKRPKYKLKDKVNHKVPAQLDTNNLYQLSQSSFRNWKSYPAIKKDAPMYGVNVYYKFGPKGRCFQFSKKGNELIETDLNPNNHYYSKDYYYSTEGQNPILIESFIYGEGTGLYVTDSYRINATGDTLRLKTAERTRVLIRKEIPKDWKKYKVDW